VSQAKWEQEREELLKRLQKAEQVAAESQSEAAVCRDLLEACYEAANQALAGKDFALLEKKARTSFSYTPTKEDTEEWGKYFLDAYMRDAGWLEDAIKALEHIKADAENLLEDNEDNAELKKKIIAAAKTGLIQHV
jgi:hypothetical protein